jgi:hypothetical protein
VISSETRETIRRLYGYCCGYCSVHEHEAGSELETDHFQPRAAGGSDELENLVYCCPACNKLKADFWSASDPLTNPRRLLHPQRDRLREHLMEDENGQLVALSETGAFHIGRLRLNRPPLLALRQRRHLGERTQQELAVTLADHERLRQRITELSEALKEALAQLDRLQGE